MIQVDLPVAFAIGQAYAFLSRNYLRKTREIFTNQLLGPLNFYLSCGYVPTGLYFLIAWPSWETFYLTGLLENPFNRPLSAGFYVLFMLLMVILGNAGFMMAHHCYFRKKDRLAGALFIITLLLTFLPFLLRWGVWLKIGNYAQFKTGAGYPMAEPPFLYGMIGNMSYFFITSVIAGLWFRKKGKLDTLAGVKNFDTVN